MAGWLTDKLRRLIGQLSSCRLLLDGRFIGRQSNEVDGSFTGLSGLSHSFAYSYISATNWLVCFFWLTSCFSGQSVALISPPHLRFSLQRPPLTLLMCCEPHQQNAMFLSVKWGELASHSSRCEIAWGNYCWVAGVSRPGGLKSDLARLWTYNLPPACGCCLQFHKRFMFICC